MKLYTAGPMRGIPEGNFPLFDRTQLFLEAQDHDVISPAEHDRQVGLSPEAAATWGGGFDGLSTFHDLMRWDLEQILSCDGIVLLPGWEKSEGALAERRVAEVTGKRIFILDGVQLSTHWQPTGMHEEVPPLLIGLSGYAQAGKDTVGQILVSQHGFERVAFADAIRQLLYHTNPIVLHRGIGELGTWEDPCDEIHRLQEVIDNLGWDRAKVEYPEIRQLQQKVGTEGGRDVLGDDIWVRTAMANVKPGGRYVFTDVRFPNEADAIERAGGKVLRIQRKGSRPVNPHPSETAVDDWRFAYTLDNNGSIGDLEFVINELGAREGWSRAAASRV